MTELVAPFVPVHGSWTCLPDMISYPEGRSTIHEPGRRELPTQSYIRLLSWLDTNLISYPEGRSTIHEPGRRELPTQSYIRPLSWLDTNLLRQEPEEEDLVPASSDEGL